MRYALCVLRLPLSPPPGWPTSPCSCDNCLTIAVGFLKCYHKQGSGKLGSHPWHEHFHSSIYREISSLIHTCIRTKAHTHMNTQLLIQPIPQRCTPRLVHSKSINRFVHHTVGGKGTSKNRGPHIHYTNQFTHVTTAAHLTLTLICRNHVSICSAFM